MSLPDWSKNIRCVHTRTHTHTHGFPPAVDYHGPGVWRVAGLHPAQEGQERSGMLGHAVVRPGCELELTYLSLLTGATLWGYTHTQMYKYIHTQSHTQCLYTPNQAYTHRRTHVQTEPNDWTYRRTQIQANKHTHLIEGKGPDGVGG